jgi:hypothetical protein
VSEVISLQAVKEARIPHLRGPAKCLACGHEWEGVTPEGVFDGLECSACGLRRGIFQGLVIPETAFVCNCGNSLFFVVPHGCQCAQCGVLAKGF